MWMVPKNNMDGMKSFNTIEAGLEKISEQNSASFLSDINAHNYEQFHCKVHIQMKMKILLRLHNHIDISGLNTVQA